MSECLMLMLMLMLMPDCLMPAWLPDAPCGSEFIREKSFKRSAVSTVPTSRE
jgi:hypothetical protein